LGDVEDVRGVVDGDSGVDGAAEVVVRAGQEGKGHFFLRLQNAIIYGNDGNGDGASTGRKVDAAGEWLEIAGRSRGAGDSVGNGDRADAAGAESDEAGGGACFLIGTWMGDT